MYIPNINDIPTEKRARFVTELNFSINFPLPLSRPPIFIGKQIWREYDSDNSGYIEADELKNFLRDLLREAKKINDVSEDKLIEYTDTMVCAGALFFRVIYELVRSNKEKFEFKLKHFFFR